VPVTRRIHFW